MARGPPLRKPKGVNDDAPALALDRADRGAGGVLVDKQNNQDNLGVIFGDRIRNVLQQDRFAGARRRDNQPL